MSTTDRTNGCRSFKLLNFESILQVASGDDSAIDKLTRQNKIRIIPHKYEKDCILLSIIESVTLHLVEAHKYLQLVLRMLKTKNVIQHGMR